MKTINRLRVVGLLSLLFFSAQQLLSQVRINEFIAANINANFNAAWNHVDWVELYNTTGSVINLNNYSLSDDPNNPRKYVIWGEIQIQPYGYLVIALDKEDYVRPAYQSVHTNFSLDMDGEFLGIYSSSGNVLDSITFGQQVANVSYGRLLSNTNEWGYFVEPTPAAANNTSYLNTAETAGEVSFSVTPGFHSGNVLLELIPENSTEEVRYTLNGDYPTSNSPVYHGPLTISESTVVRARCFTAEKHPGTVLSGSYFIDMEIPDLPIVSLSTDIENFEDWTYGIYVDGSNGMTNPWCSPDKKVNWMRDWERPINFEFFTQDGEQHISQLVGTKIFGGCSRAVNLRSLSLISRKDYGKRGLDYKFFVDKDVDYFKSLVLRNSGNDAVSTMLRDGFMQTVVKDRMDIDNQAYQPVLVYLNGEYFGLLNLREKMNEHYADSNHDADPDEVDVIEQSQYVANGNNEAFDALMAYINSHSLSNQAAFDEVASQLDVTEYLNYFITHIYYENEDWPQNNMKIWRERKEGAKWRALLYDTDFGFGLYEKSGNTLTWATREHISTEIFRALLQNETCKNEFIQRFAAHINTTFNPDRILPILDSLEALVSPHIPYQVTNWRVPYSNWEWNYNVNDKMVYFANNQPDNVRGWIRDYFGISGMQTLTTSILTPGMGSVEVCEVQVPDSYSGQHFKGVPTRLKANSKPGFSFVGWTGDIISADEEIWVDMNSDISVSASFAMADPISGIYINEIVAKNNTDFTDDFGEVEDWIEIYNSNDYEVDLAGLYISDSVGYLGSYQIPFGMSSVTTVPPKSYIVIWADSDSKQGPLHLPFKLDKDGETLFLSQQTGAEIEVIDSISFSKQFSDASYGRDPVNTALWKLLIPTPGEINEDRIIENIYINEFMASNKSVHPDKDGVYEDWIELYNDNNYPVNVAGMFLSDTVSRLTRFRIPSTYPDSTTIPAKGHLLFWADDSTEQGILHLNFGLSNEGEQIILTQPNGIEILDSLTFSDLKTNTPYGCVPDANRPISCVIATPGKSNVQPEIHGVYINELMASNSTVLQDNYGEYDDWFELYNSNDYPVNVGGLFLTDNQNRPEKFRISTEYPDSTTIPAKGYIVFWADDSTEQGILHTNFKLSNSGEKIILCNSTAKSIIDSVSFNSLISDTPFGRKEDGSKELGYLSPTPGASNRIEYLENIFINEALASNSAIIADEFGEYDDYIELYNGNNFAVDVAGLFITDEFDIDAGYQIPKNNSSETTIEANSFLLIWADDSTEQGTLHANFKLNRSGEKIVLLQADGSTVLDSLSFGEQQNNISFGRFPNGTSTRVKQIPSPGAANRVASYEGIMISEVMASDHTGLKDEFGEYEDWIELYNASSTAIDVAGMAITDSIPRTDRYFIPSGHAELTTIQPGEYLVLWADNQPDQGALHLGFGLREGGEQVGLFSLEGTLLDTLTYPNQYNNFSWALLDGELWLPLPPTPNAENTAPKVGKIFINEYMSDNENRVMDEFGEFDDWVEIYNANSFPVDLGGMYLTDSIGEPNMYRIPSNDPEATTIPPSGFMLIWTDSDASQGPLHSNFKLSRKGDLFSIRNYDYREEIETKIFTKQYSNFASGRENETDRWVDLPPTPGSSNIYPDLSGLFINEIMTSNSTTIADNYGEFDDWIELYNGSTNPIDIGGMFISDTVRDNNPFRISSDHPDSTTIDPGEYILIWADDSVEQGIWHADFKLSRSGEQVAIFGYDGETIIDSITYKEVPRNFTYGRIIDGSRTWNELVKPTPLSSNLITSLDETKFQLTGFSFTLYPNPANREVTINFSLSQATEVIIKVYDNVGNLVAVPVDNIYPAGTNEIIWNLTTTEGKLLMPGMYHYILESEKMYVEEKLIILGN